LWYEQKEEVFRTYTDDMPKRIPLEDNVEFKKIKNIIIKEALNLTNDDNDVTNEELPSENDEKGYGIPKSKTRYKEKSNSVSELSLSNSAFAYIRLLRYLSDLIKRQLKLDDDENEIRVESKLKRKIDDKKRGLGLH
jgi:hypothetical protein